MSKIFLVTILLTFFTTDIHASERSECLVAVEKGKEIINVNGMKVYSCLLYTSPSPRDS